ncbi:MAG: hypothetical protein KDC44_24325, partial [Phaeodactylibacter sp.]|nr:hypothetical protein [Phaeodactylibacter sp.]
MQYHELEEAVFQYLMDRHKKDKKFTFSVRKKRNRGAERDYFIGKESAGYFGFTLWNTPISYPGSSTDLMDFLVLWQKDDTWKIQFNLNTTRSPQDFNNERALELGTALRKVFKETTLPGYKYWLNPPENKMEFFTIFPEQNSFVTDLAVIRQLD